MSFLKGLFETKDRYFEHEAVPSALEASARATGSSVSSVVGAFGMGQAGDWDIDKAVNRALERVVWVFRCVDVIAQNQATLPIRVRKGSDRRDGEFVDDQWLWNLLNMRANPYEQAWQFRYRLSANLLLSRRGAFVEVVNARNGRPAQLHILPAGTTYPVPDPLNFVAGYRVHRQDGKVDYLPADRVIWLRLKPHPTDPYSQLTPLMAAGVSAETDWLVHMFNRNFLANDGRPGLLVSIAGQLNPQDAEEIKRRFSGGPSQAGKTSVIEADGVAVVDLSATPRDAQWDRLLDMAKNEILMAFGVPESMIGNSADRTYSNAGNERTNFWLDAMPAHCDAIAQGLDPLTGSNTDGIVLAYDYSGVDVYQAVEQRRHEEKRAEFLAGLCTIDDYFEVVGRKPWDVPGTRVLFKQGGGIIAQNDEDKKATQDLAGPGAMEGTPFELPGGVPGLAPGAPDPFLDPDVLAAKVVDMMARSAEPPARQRVQRSLTGIRRNEYKMIEAEASDGPVQITGVPEDHPFGSERLHEEGVLEGIVDGWDARQGKVIAERVEHAKFRKGTRHWEGETKDAKPVDPEYAVQTKEWQDEIRDLVGRRVRAAILREARRAAKELQSSGVLDQVIRDRGTRSEGDLLVKVFGSATLADRALEDLYNRVMGIVDNASSRQSGRLRDTIAELDQQGRSVSTIQRAVRSQVGQRSQWRKALSVNVVTAATEGARQIVMANGGAYVTKKWHAHKDERVRDTHRLADGQEVGVRQPFTVGTATLMFPGDPTAPPGEVVNCRCWMSFHASPTPIP